MKIDKGGINSEMNKIDTDFVRQMWQYKPEFSTADTSSISNLYCTTTSTDNDDAYIAAEIDRRVNEIYRRREAEMDGIKFNDLEKDLNKLGIALSKIRHSYEDGVVEIEGYLNPEVYNKSRISRKKDDKKPTWVCQVLPKMKKVIFSGPATTIIWKDGTKTTVKCQKEDVWSDEVGIAMCCLKRVLGNEGNFNNIFREAMKVAEVQTKKEELASSTVIEGESYYSSALNNMKRNIDEINDFMKDAADALDKALGGKK